MDDLEGPVCTVCQEDYDENAHVPRIFNCGHSICSSCLPNLLNTNPNCPSCRAACSAREEDIPRNYQLLDTLLLQKTLKNDNAVLLGDKDKLTAEYQELVNKYEEMVLQKKKRENRAVICGECDEEDSESNIQICRTCSMEKFQWDFVRTVQNESDLELAVLAVCSNCAIRRHYKFGHEVLDFNPIQIAHKYVFHAANLSCIRSDARSVMECLKAEVSELYEAFDRGEKELDRMVDMIRRAKSSEVQENVANRIETTITTNTDFFTQVKSLIEEKTAEMKAMVVSLAAENEEIEKRDCIPECDVSPNGLLDEIFGVTRESK